MWLEKKLLHQDRTKPLRLPVLVVFPSLSFPVRELRVNLFLMRNYLFSFWVGVVGGGYKEDRR